MALPKLGSVSQDAGVQDGTSPGNGIHCLSWRTCLYSYIYIYIDINQRNKGDSGARWLNLRKIAEDIFSTIRTSKMSSTRFDFAAWTKIQLYKTGQCFGQCYFAFAFTSQYTELQLPTGFNTPAWRIIPAKVSTATAISKRTCQRTSKMWQHKHSPSSQTTRGWQLALDHGYLGTEFHRIDKHAKHGVDHQVIFRMSYGYSHQSLSPRNFKDIPISVVLGLSSLTNTLSKMAIICSSPPPPSSLHSQKVAKNPYVPWFCHHVDGPLKTKLHWVTLRSSQVAPMARSIQLLGSPSMPWWRWSSKIFLWSSTSKCPKK